MRNRSKLLGNFQPQPPFLRILLQHHKDIYQILPYCWLEDGNKVREMSYGSNLQHVGMMLEDVIKSRENVLSRFLWPNDLSNLMQTRCDWQVYFLYNPLIT